MPNSKCKTIINSLLLISLLTPTFGFAQTTQVPQTMGEAQTLGLNILERLPDAIKSVWYNQALPIWLNMWRIAKSLWENGLGAKVEMLWQKFLGLIGKESPDVKGEFQKEQQEMKKDLWERLKELLN